MNSAADSHDTALARVLHREGVLPLETIQTVLADVRARRQSVADVTLAGTLLARQLLSGEQLDRAHGLLAAESGFQAALSESSGGLEGLGAYAIVREIARGGMGVVYEAVHASTGAPYALKTILVESEGFDEEEVERFRREGLAMARLQHPNVARVYAADFSGRTPYLVQDLLTGGTLQEHGEKRELGGEEVRSLVLALAEGLAHSHAAGILHRDLKPENVLFSSEGVPKLVDFGLAFKVGANSQRLTQTGALMGTPAYMAPEQALGLRDFDARVDVYGLGGILYFLLCGQAPFAGGLYRILEQVINAPPERPSKLREGVPRDLEAICLRALAKEPDERYPSMEDFAQALREGAAPGGRSLGSLALVGGVGALVLAALGLGAWASRDASPVAGTPRATPQPSASPAQVTVSPSPASASPTPGSVGFEFAALRSWDPGAGALGGEGRGVARIGTQIVTLERPTVPVKERRGVEHHHRRLGVVRRWAFETGRELGRLDLGGEDPLAMAVSPNRSLVAFATPRQVLVFDTQSWSRSHTLDRPRPNRHTSRAPVLQFSPSGSRLALTHGAKTGVQVWSLPGGELQDFPVARLTRLAFRGEEQLLLGFLNPPRLGLLDFAEGRVVRESSLGGRNKGAPKALLVSPSGGRAYVGCWDQSLRVWDLEAWKEDSIELGAAAMTLRFDVSSEDVLAFTFQGPVLRVSRDSLRVAQIAEGWGGRVTGDVFEEGLLVVGTDQRLRRLSSQGRPLWKTRRDAGPARALVMGEPQIGVMIAEAKGLWPLRDLGESPNDSIWKPRAGTLDFASGVPGRPGLLWLSSARSARLLSVESLPFRRVADVKRTDFRSLAAAPDGKRALATIQGPKGFQLVQLGVVGGPSLTLTAVGERGWPGAGAASVPPALHVTASGVGVSGDARGVLETWDLSGAGKALGRSKGGAIVSLASQGDQVFAGTREGSVRRRAVSANFEEAPLEGQGGPILALCVLPNQRLASASEDGTLRIYDLESGRVLREVDYSETGDAPQLLARSSEDRLLVYTLRGWVHEYSLGPK